MTLLLSAPAALRLVSAATAIGCTWVTLRLTYDGVTADAFDRESYVSALGLWSMRVLLLSLAMTPLSRLTRIAWLRQLRRTFGLWGVVLALAHMLFYIWSGGLWPDYMGLLVTRPYLLCGTIAAVLLGVMAASSPRAVLMRIGPDAKRRLHRAVFVAMPLLIAHESLYLQDDYVELALHAVAATLLLGVRIADAVRARRRA